jgi:hypothetical protein
MSQNWPGSWVMSRFERIKTEYNGEGGNGWHFHFNLSAPGADPAFSNHGRRRVVLQPEDVRALYEPVLRKIFGLILSQITACKWKMWARCHQCERLSSLPSGVTWETKLSKSPNRKWFWLVDSVPHPICRKDYDMP